MSNAFRDKILSLGLIVKSSPRLEYGSNAPSEYVSSKETGGLPAYIMSEGLLEKEEIADIKAAVIEKEQKRVRQSAQKTKLESLVNLAHQTPKGKRSKTINEAIKEIGG